MIKKVLIIGGGMAGCSSAEILSKNENLEVTLVEKGNHLGAGIRTYFYGNHPYTFGPRLFLTSNKNVYDYMNKIVPLKDYNNHEFVTYVEKDNKFYNFPIHFDDIDNMPDKDEIYEQLKNKKISSNPENLKEYWLGAIGENLFEKFINNYNKKMWKVDDCAEIDTFSWSPKGVGIRKKGEKKSPDHGSFCGYPISKYGYNSYFDNLEKRLNLKIFLNTEIKFIDIKNKKFKINNDEQKFDIVISSISPDILFGQKEGELPFLGRDIFNIVLPIKEVLPKDIFFVYYANKENFTRIVEYKKFTGHQCNSTLIGLEIPSLNGKHYPLPIKKYQNLAKKYLDLLPEGFYSIGRAGSYFYSLDIDDCIYQSMLIEKEIKSSNLSQGIIGEQYKIEKRI